MTSTEFANFFWLRNHEDAQPEIKILAERMQKAMAESTPIELFQGEWHLPFIRYYRDTDGILWYSSDTVEILSLETAKKISASACAQVSYRKNDLSLEKAEMIWDKLIFSEPCHASPVEHQATPMMYTLDSNYDGAEAWEPGVTHMTRNGELWSGNFRGWVQHRKLLDNEAKW
jgi:thymidylate synthase ThyX